MCLRSANTSFLGAQVAAVARFTRGQQNALIGFLPGRLNPGITGSSSHNRTCAVGAAVAAAALLIAAGGYFFGPPGIWPKSDLGAPTSNANAQGAPTRPLGGASRDAPSLDLTDVQLASVKVEPVGEREFPLEKESVGSIDFNEDMTLQVFTPYQGRIIGLFAKVGDDVKKGQTLFTIDSPDLLTAESTLIAAAGVLELTTRNLARLRQLYTTRAISQKDLEQAVSDQQTAEGALRASRDSVRLFGKTDAEIDGIIAKRMADPTLVVPSPITGRITARNAAPGLFVQPGVAPAPYSVGDISTMWEPFTVAHQNAGGDYDTLTRIERREPELLDRYPGLGKLSVAPNVSTLGEGDRLRAWVSRARQIHQARIGRARGRYAGRPHLPTACARIVPLIQ
jgi:multidrug efflux pump subunit AcrA (membrane-fusion protein)